MPVFLVERDVDHPIEIRGQFDVTLDQRGYTLWTEFAYEKSKLENDVLSRARTQK